MKKQGSALTVTAAAGDTSTQERGRNVRDSALAHTSADMPSEAAADEQALLARSAAGDIDAFGDLLRAYQPRVFGLVRRLVVRRDEAMEVTQEVFLQAFKTRARFDRNRGFRSWLFGIALNVCRNHLRRASRREQPQDLAPTAEVLWSEQAASPEQLLMQQDGTGMVQRLLLRLSPDDRALLLFRYHQDLSYRELSEVYGRPESVLKMRVHRAFKRLQALVLGELQ